MHALQTLVLYVIKTGAKIRENAIVHDDYDYDVLIASEVLFFACASDKDKKARERGVGLDYGLPKI